MANLIPSDCSHNQRTAEMLCGSYFVKCASCNATLITIPWFSAEPLLQGELTVSVADTPDREKIASGPAEVLIPYVRELLVSTRRLALSGQYAVIGESQLGSIKNNPLEVQREYFSLIITVRPSDESAPFSLAQVLRELGEEDQAGAIYDAAIRQANHNWRLVLPRFLLPSFAVAAALQYFSAPLWWAIPVAVTGVLLWYWIHRNRQRGIPTLGFDQRAQTAALIDMRAELDRIQVAKVP